MGRILSLMGKGLKGVGKAGYKVGKAGIGGVGSASQKLAYGTGKTITNNALKNPALFAGAIGTGIIGGAALADVTNNDVKEGAKKMGLASAGIASIGGAGAVVGLGAGVLGGVAGATGGAAWAGSKMIKMPKGPINEISDIKLSGLGKFALGAGLVASSGAKMYKAFENSRMGTNDGMLRSATPTIPRPIPMNNSNSYAYDAGATGDLVFDMYDLR